MSKRVRWATITIKTSNLDKKIIGILRRLTINYTEIGTINVVRVTKIRNLKENRRKIKKNKRKIRNFEVNETGKYHSIYKGK